MLHKIQNSSRNFSRLDLGFVRRDRISDLAELFLNTNLKNGKIKREDSFYWNIPLKILLLGDVDLHRLVFLMLLLFILHAMRGCIWYCSENLTCYSRRFDFVRHAAGHFPLKKVGGKMLTGYCGISPLCVHRWRGGGSFRMILTIPYDFDLVKMGRHRLASFLHLSR